MVSDLIIDKMALLRNLTRSLFPFLRATVLFLKKAAVMLFSKETTLCVISGSHPFNRWRLPCFLSPLDSEILAADQVLLAEQGGGKGVEVFCLWPCP